MKTERGLWLTRTERKAMAAPVIEAHTAKRNPGQIPYVKPMSVIDPAKPNKGGCEAITMTEQTVN